MEKGVQYARTFDIFSDLFGGGAFESSDDRADGLVRASEFVKIFLIGVLEKIEHTQLIPGVKFLFISPLLYIALSILLFILYDRKFKLPWQIRVSNFLLLLLIIVQLLGLAEIVEHVQFVPGVSILDFFMFSFPLYSVLFFVLHAWSIKWKNKFISIFGILSWSLNSFAFSGLVWWGDVRDGTYYFIAYLIFGLIAFITTFIFLLGKENRYKGNMYHYIRYILLGVHIFLIYFGMGL